ncbi:MAG: hypothetical protein KIS83_22075 [Rubrivivax sp.]|nr:hypothetical protein [Rubrivivax sp.]
MPRGRDDPAWPDTQRMVRGRDDLLSPKTQIVADRDDYLGQGRNDVGRRIGEDQVELFVTGDVAHSLQQEFSLHQPEFIALHDVGTSASLRLLSSLAAAAGARVQRLSIRRQGHGVALAVLQFVEVSLKDGSAVRVYSTDVSVDAAQRAQIARVLLAHSKLGVLLVGDLPPNALAGQLAPLHESLRRGPWPNRDLLLLPLGSSIALAAPAAQLGADTPVAVHVTPHASKPKHAWNFIGGAWNRLHGRPGGERALSTELNDALPRPAVPSSQAPTEPMPLEPAAASPALHGARRGRAADAAVRARRDAADDDADAGARRHPLGRLHRALRRDQGRGRLLHLRHPLAAGHGLGRQLAGARTAGQAGGRAAGRHRRGRTRPGHGTGAHRGRHQHAQPPPDPAPRARPPRGGGAPGAAGRHRQPDAGQAAARAHRGAELTPGPRRAPCRTGPSGPASCAARPGAIQKL